MKTCGIVLALAAMATSIYIDLDGNTGLLDSTLTKREYILSSCNSDYGKVVLAVENCYELANACVAATESGNDDLMVKYFGNSTQATRDFAAETYRRVASQCAAVGGGTTQLICDATNSGSYCGSVKPYAGTAGNQTQLCEAFFQTPDYPSSSAKVTTATVMIHELTHSSQVRSTLDVDTEGMLMNAMNYGHFAEDLGLEC